MDSISNSEQYVYCSVLTGVQQKPEAPLEVVIVYLLIYSLPNTIFTPSFMQSGVLFCLFRYYTGSYQKRLHGLK